MTEKKNDVPETAPNVGAIADLQRDQQRLVVVAGQNAEAIADLIEIVKRHGDEIEKLKELRP